MAKKRQYAKDNIDRAVKYVQDGGSKSAAAKLFGVPRSTIQFKIKNPDTKFKSGPDPVLNVDEELAIENWILKLAKQGFPRKKEDVTAIIQSYLTKNPRPNPFKNNKPGDCWFKAFLKRHPAITTRTSEGVTNASSCVAEEDIRKWFAQISEYFQEQNLTEALEDPSRIFNADETGFNICQKTGKVLAEKGSKNVYEIEKSSSKENITVMFAFSASGSTLDPLIIYPYKRLPEKICSKLPPTWGVARSDKGWMTAQVFYEYIANVFYPQLVRENITLPVILYVDGHKSHLSQEVTALCVELGIHLIALYPNATRILQPADVAAFKPIKSAWQKGLRAWYAEHNYEATLNKVTFGPLLEKVIRNCLSKETLVNGFSVTGLYPFNADNVDYTKCLAKTGDDPIKYNNNQDTSEIMWKMDYKIFTDIVGKDKIKEFSDTSVDTLEGDRKVIYRLWLKFRENGSNIGYRSNADEEVYVPDVVSESDTTTHSPVCFTEHNKQSNKSDEDILLNPVTGIFYPNPKATATHDVNLKPVSAEDVYKITAEKNDTPNNLKSLSTSSEEPGIACMTSAERYDIANNYKSLPSSSKEPNIACLTAAERYDIANNLNVLPSSSKGPDKTINVISDEPLADYLKRRFWPKTPKRKGKRDTEKRHFAITSTACMEMVRSKNDLKEKSATEKENRKKKREEQKQNKLNTQPKTKKRKIKDTDKENDKNKINSGNIDMEDTVKTIAIRSPLKKIYLMCSACKCDIKSLSVLCSECQLSYHQKCIPLKHRVHIPSEEEDDFVCHNCFNIESDSSVDDIFNYIASEKKRITR